MLGALIRQCKNWIRQTAAVNPIGADFNRTRSEFLREDATAFSIQSFDHFDIVETIETQLMSGG